MRILSVDYGKKRCGLAVTDPLQIIANGLVTVATCDLFDYLSAYIQKEEVERIVIGKPTQLSGKPSENLARVEQFVNRWRKTHPEIPIVFYGNQCHHHTSGLHALPSLGRANLFNIINSRQH